jgi:hypothetical protein
MNFRHILAALLLSLFSLGVVHAAGSPINEDFTALKGFSEKLIVAGKASDTTAFVSLADEAIGVAKDQGNKGGSPTLQRVSLRYKNAKKLVKAGKFDDAIKLVEETLVEMNKPKQKLNFGGGTEERKGGLY